MAALWVVVALLISVLFVSGCASTGEIVIEKVTIANPDPTEQDWEFHFTLTGGASALNQSFSLKSDQLHFSGDVLPGDGYSAAEIALADWDLTSASCDDGSPVNNIDVAPGETVTCTFENTKKVEIVIYTDFQCSICWSLHSEIEEELINRYVNNGKAYLDLRMLPMFGSSSLRAAEAALCAADQGQFWEYRDVIFSAWLHDGESAYSEDELRGAAHKLGLNEDSFTACLQSGAKRAEVEGNMLEAEAAGVWGVPWVLINGFEVPEDALLSLETYIEVIDAQLR